MNVNNRTLIQRSHLGLLLLFVLCLNACSDSGTSPDTNTGASGFAILSADKDSVLWEDMVTARVRNAPSGSFTVFLHTSQAVVDSTWKLSENEHAIRFRVPVNATSGRIRVYVSDDNSPNEHEATGDVSLYIYPRRRSSIDPHVTDFYLKRAYAGDIVQIYGSDLQFSDLKIVRVNDVILPIIGWDSNVIRVRVPESMQTGPVCVKLSKKEECLPVLEKLEHGQEFLPDNGVYFSWIQLSGFLGKQKRTQLKDGTFFIEPTMPEISFNPIFSQPSQVQRFGDSIVCILKAGDVKNNTEVVVRLKLEDESRVSGTILSRVEHERASPSGKYERLEVIAEIKNMRWMPIAGGISINSFTDDIKETLVSLTHTKQVGTELQELIEWTPDPNISHVTIELK